MPSIAEDRSDIMNLLWRYANAIDLYANADGELEAWLDTLAPDIVVEYPGARFAGYQEMTQLAGKTKEYGDLRHIIVNPEVEVDADAASVRAVLHLYKGLILHSVKWYYMKIVRTAGGWRIAAVNIVPAVDAAP